MHDSSYFDEARTHKNIMQEEKKHKKYPEISRRLLACRFVTAAAHSDTGSRHSTARPNGARGGRVALEKSDGSGTTPRQEKSKKRPRSGSYVRPLK